MSTTDLQLASDLAEALFDRAEHQEHLSKYENDLISEVAKRKHQAELKKDAAEGVVTRDALEAGEIATALANEAREDARTTTLPTALLAVAWSFIRAGVVYPDHAEQAAANIENLIRAVIKDAS